MQFGDHSLDYAFDPLKVVDVKTMAAVIENLKKSNDKGKRAIGVFLDRINRLRTPGSPSEKPSVGTTSKTLKSSGLSDLRE